MNCSYKQEETFEKTEYTTRTKTVKSVAIEDAWARNDKLTKKMQRSEEGKLTNIQAVLPSSEKGLFDRYTKSAICNSNSMYQWATLHQHAI